MLALLLCYKKWYSCCKSAVRHFPTGGRDPVLAEWLAPATNRHQHRKGIQEDHRVVSIPAEQQKGRYFRMGQGVGTSGEAELGRRMEDQWADRGWTDPGKGARTQQSLTPDPIPSLQLKNLTWVGFLVWVRLWFCAREKGWCRSKQIFQGQLYSKRNRVREHLAALPGPTQHSGGQYHWVSGRLRIGLLNPHDRICQQKTISISQLPIISHSIVSPYL